MGRPGGGGMGRPVNEDTGGRGRESPESPGAGVEGRLGRIVVGPSGEGRGGATGFGGGPTRGERTVRVVDSSLGRGELSAVTGDGAGVGGLSGAGSGFAEVFTSCAPARRSPSASALRRMRSAWASSMDAEGLEAPIPSV
jgi:hypothetical protein